MLESKLSRPLAVIKDSIYVFLVVYGFVTIGGMYLYPAIGISGISKVPGEDHLFIAGIWSTVYLVTKLFQISRQER